MQYYSLSSNDIQEAFGMHQTNETLCERYTSAYVTLSCIRKGILINILVKMPQITDKYYITHPLLDATCT